MIFGLEPQHPLPEQWTPLEAVAVVKCLDEDGDLGLVLASTHGLTSWETLGMLTGAAEAQNNALQSYFEDDE